MCYREYLSPWASTKKQAPWSLAAKLQLPPGSISVDDRAA